MWPNPQFPADLVTFTEEIINGKLHFLCIVNVHGRCSTAVIVIVYYCKYTSSFKQNTHSFVSSILSFGIKGQGSSTSLIPKG